MDGQEGQPESAADGGWIGPCGTQNAASAKFCTGCGTPNPNPPTQVGNADDGVEHSQIYDQGWVSLGCFGRPWRDRYRLYRSQILQENMRWKALAEIYKMHSFAPFSWDPVWVKKYTKMNIEKVKSGKS